MTDLPGVDPLQPAAQHARSVARDVLHDEHLADDAVQQTWRMFLERPPQSSARLGGWFCKVTRNFALQSLRERRRRVAREQRCAAAEITPASPSAVCEARELHRCLHEELERLQPLYRGVVEQRFFAGLSAQAIARNSGEPVATVRSRLQRGLVQLRSRLEARARDWRPALLVAKAAAMRTIAMLRATRARGFLAQHRYAAFGGGAAAALVGLVGFVFVDGSGGEPAPRGDDLAVLAPLDLPALDRAPARRQSAGERPVATVQTQDAPAVRLRVLREADGRPVAGMALRVYCLAEGTPQLTPREASTDATGVATFADAAAGLLDVVGDRGGELHLELQPGRPLFATLLLPRGIDVSGRVVDGAGQGIAGASIWLASAPGTRAGACIATCDESGAFAIDDVQPGRALSALAPGFAAATLAPLAGAPGDRRTLDFRLEEPDAGVAGRVTDPHGKPLAGARVQADGSADRPTLETTTGADGRFAIAGIRGGVARIAARSRGLACSVEEVALAPRATAAIELELTAGARLRGRAVDVAGRPRRGVMICDGGPFDLAASSVVTGADGAFELDGVRAGSARFEAIAPEGTATLCRRFDDLEVVDWQPELPAARPVEPADAGLGWRCAPAH